MVYGKLVENCKHGRRAVAGYRSAHRLHDQHIWDCEFPNLVVFAVAFGDGGSRGRAQDFQKEAGQRSALGVDRGLWSVVVNRFDCS